MYGFFLSRALIKLTPSIAAVVTVVETQLKDIVQNLYNLIVQSFDHHGGKTQEAMKREM